MLLFSRLGQSCILGAPSRYREGLDLKRKTRRVGEEAETGCFDEGVVWHGELELLF